MRSRYANFLTACLLVCAGCSVRVTDFTVISTKNSSITQGLTEAPRVKGEDCVTVFLLPLGSPNLKAAIDNAIEKAGPKYDALKDGVVIHANHSFLFGQVCYEVSGTPVSSTKTRDLPAADVETPSPRRGPRKRPE